MGVAPYAEWWANYMERFMVPMLLLNNAIYLNFNCSFTADVIRGNGLGNMSY